MEHFISRFPRNNIHLNHPDPVNRTNMANYIFLMQFNNETMLTPEQGLRMITVSEIGCGLSLVSSVMTLCLLCFLPTKGDGLFIVGNMCVALMGAQLSFIGAENTSYPNEAWCKTATCIIHYLFLCVHFASLAFAQHLWSRFGSQSIQACQKRGVYVAIIWLLPLLIVGSTALWRADLYAKDKLCWLPYEHSTRLAFLLPLAIVLMLNVLLYMMLILTRITFDLKKKQPISTILRHVSMTSLSLFPVLSLQWLIGFSVTFEGPLFLHYAYVVMCSGQGMCLLIFHVIPNGQVKKALCAKMSEKSSGHSASSSSSRIFTLYSNLEVVQKKEEKPAEKK